MKLAVVLPAATVTLEGRRICELQGGGGFCARDSDTSLPPDGAALLRLTVPVELLPPVTLLGLKLIDEIGTPGVSVREACTVLFPRVAVITTVVLLRTNPLVVTGKVALVAPAGTVTLPGTIIKELLLLNPTAAPPGGAAPLKVTVPVDVPPFEIVVGFSVSDDSVIPPHAPPAVFGVSLYTVP